MEHAPLKAHNERGWSSLITRPRGAPPRCSGDIRFIYSYPEAHSTLPEMRLHR